MRNSIWIALLIALACIGLGSAALGQNLPKLPDALTLPQSGDSPGKVTFLHVSHVGERPDCTQCHPTLFSIVKQPAGAPAGTRKITHANMEKGRQCGACHNGKKAFGFDDCTACHRQ
jgi:c(7)-type cytochrome triheme protein